MRILSKFLTLLLCLELIVSPIVPNISMTISNAYAETCPQGFQFDNILNRCLTKTETANVMNATMNCGSDKECYKDNAKRVFMENGSAPDAKGDSFVSKIAIGAATAGAVTYAAMALMKKTSGCKSPAFYGMIGGALALVIGDNLANMQHAKRLKKIQEDWGKVVNPEEANGDKDKERESSIEAQSEAFEMLARAEDSLAQAAKMKQKFFMVASLAFGVTAGISAMEMINNRSLKLKAVASSKKAVIDTVAGMTKEATTTMLPPATPSGKALASVQQAAVDVGTAAMNKEAFDASEMKAGSDKDALAAVGNKIGENTKKEEGKQKVVISQKKAVISTKTATAAATGSTAMASIQTAQQDMAKWEEHTRVTTCDDTGDEKETPAPAEQAKVEPQAPIEPKVDEAPIRSNPPPIDDSLEGFREDIIYIQSDKQSLYSYYLKPKHVDIKAELQAMYNLKNSTDMTSFVMNKWEMEGALKSPLEDYEFYKDSLNASVPDKSVFEAFKAISIATLEFMNPIASAHAREEMQVDGGDGSEPGARAGARTGTGTTAGTRRAATPTPGVDTNAAKDYKEVKAKGFDYTTLIGGALAGGALAFSGIGKELLTSKGRLIFSGVMTAMTLLMAKHAGSQAEASEKRAELLRKMKDEFKSASGAIYACKSEDRNDPAKPNCYCYTAENQRNPNRGSSQICQKLWAGKNTTINPLASAGSSRVCVNSNRQADAACSCRQTNTCMKVKLSGVGGLDMGSMSVLGNGLAPVNGILGGSIDGANLSPATIGAQIAKVDAINKALEKDPLIAKAKNSKAALKLQKQLEKGGASLGSSGLLGGSGSSSMPSNPGEAARMLEKEIKDATAPTSLGGGDFIAAPAPVAEETLEFGMTGDQLAAQEGQIAEVMDKDLDYGGNDINQGSNKNIFEVLSNRYQRSGMRRLFDEKGEAKPEAAATTDITQ